MQNLIPNKLYIGDSREILRTFPEDSIHCVVTSPPYFGLRSYLNEGDEDKGKEIGTETTIEDYVNNMLEVFAEIKRVLHPQGVVWLNLGDSYNGSGKAGKDQANHINFNSNLPKKKRYSEPFTLKSMKPKDLMGVPWTVAFALRDRQNWYLRQEIIWSKPNPMPEPTKDRCTKSHEHIFLLSKSKTYWFDFEAIREPSVDLKHSKERYESAFGGKKALKLQETNEASRAIGIKEFDGKRNKRSVWEVNVSGYKGSHYAVFPTKLIEPMILAGCPQEVCSTCNSPYIRISDRVASVSLRTDQKRNYTAKCGARNDGNRGGSYVSVKPNFLGRKPTCECNVETKPGIVLDPFFGSGTVGVVAAKYGRDFVGIDLNHENEKLVKERKIRKGFFSLQDTSFL